ncbi:hypothetical protein I4F81_011850 [Pyropia yezoensis]|uniref:Uncharacterized protein n=1 Tax=Pyropia yezoensis TaxID=2788 RepID=A0ACC3CHS7_PYRYE|nr:hypothetical protein I4F81_011850 [Neopyropia yezoensis]
MGLESERGDDPTQAEVISDLQSKLPEALDQVRALTEAARDANPPAVPAGAEGQGALHPGGAGDRAAHTRGAGGSGRKDDSDDGGGGGGGATPDSSSSDESDQGGGGPRPPPSPSSSDDGEADEPLHGLPKLKIGKPGEYLKDFEIPARAVKSEGLPVPFEPTDITFLSSFTDNIRDRMEATSLYQICYWLQEAVNEASDAYHSHTTYSATDMEEYHSSLVLYLKRLHRIAIKRYDFLETKQADLMLAREYERADIPAVNLHRGAGMREFRRLRDGYRHKNAAKIAAYQSGDSSIHPPSKKTKKPSNDGGGDGGGGAGGGGSGKGGGGGGRGGGGKPKKKGDRGGGKAIAARAAK